MEKTFNLNEFKTNSKSRVFSGRDRGEIARAKLDLDHEDNLTEDIVTIVFPDDTISLNSSFFLGLFGKSVRKLGEQGFEKKYQFRCSESILKSVKDGIQRALKTSGPLDF
ncbi:hypothetical protein RW092_04180 [Paenibacillus sp. 3LSP]|uniref:hypothetical protein n=1 Tax=Paenibacillus sp. 3LSP TaxID=2800795 RepID=UPI0028FD82DD|nr:hypothetical protein [Paenibacillus sp. 3LSP]MDU0329399.1 hypothetical protein [Paenibacillus sp. 3LSP]